MATPRTPLPKNKDEQKSDGDGVGDVPSIVEQKQQQKEKEVQRNIENKLKVLRVKKDTVERKIRRIQIALPQPDEPINKHHLELQLKLLESAYSEYNGFQNDVYSLNVSDDIQCVEEMKFIEVEKLYSGIFVKLTGLIESSTRREVVPVMPVPIVNAQPHIPPLKAPLPTFDGNYENWYAFKSMFENVMARYHTESPAIKLYHLRNALVGGAAGVIDQDIINNGDYDAAWATLRERYEDKRVIIDKHIDAIFNIPTMTKDSAVGLRKLIDTCSKHVDALKNLELPVSGLGEMMLLNVLAKKLDIETRKAWELDQEDELPNYKSTMDFLKERCRVYEKISRTMKPASEPVKQPRSSGKVDAKVHSLVTTSDKCQHCSGDHALWKCETFKKASLTEKYATLRKTGSCFNCLERGHMTVKCNSRSCQKCDKRHHTSLHVEESQSTESAAAAASTAPKKEAPEAGTTPSTSNTGTVLCANVGVEHDTLLATAVAFMCGTGKRMSPCRAVLDSASHKHFITEDLVSKLGLKRKRTNYSVAGIGGNPMAIEYKVHARIKSRVGDYESPCMEFLVVKKITSDLPAQRFAVQEMKIPDGVELADPKFNVPGPVDVLIGSGLFFRLLGREQLELADDMPTVQETRLGWIVSGLIPIRHYNVGRTLYTTVCEEEVGRLLERFWHFDSYDGTEEQEKSKEDGCVAHFLDTYQRNEDGRFVVRLPFNEKQLLLGNSLEMAKKRFLAVERRLDRDPTLKEQYVSFMKEYIDLKHMEEVVPSPAEGIGEAFYLPHHYVLKPTSTTTKLRVVFDGSAESSSGIPINETQMVGPTVQNDLVSILLNFRSFRFAVSADIPKMYRQVEVHEDDTRFQRIVWRADSSQPMKIFALKTVTYGLASSPFLATMALRQLATEGEERFPLAAAAIKKSFYIDDMLAGADTLDKALELLEQVSGLLKEGGFDIHKVCSNSQEILETIPEQKREKLGEIGDPEVNLLMKTLGVAWDPNSDTFTFCLPEPQNYEGVPMTKRSMLSEISRIFDPLGFLGPVLTAAKLIMRELWLLDLRWDDPLPQDFERLWVDFRSKLQQLDGVKIPRWVLSEGRVSVQLHGFSDASDLAYGACLYARSIFSDGRAEMKLICSKSRILPKKTNTKKVVTTPRAELQAALLLSRLTAKIANSMGIEFASVVLWSDSQIVLCWIQKAPDALQIFVGNRVKEIQALTVGYNWRYIPSKSNPADLVSRGVAPHLLREQEIWWYGPAMLKTAEYDNFAPPAIPDEELPELRKVALVSVSVHPRLKIFDRISRFTIIQRSMAYVVRFADYIRSGRKRIAKGLPTTDEMRRGLLLAVRLVQSECFANEIRMLKEEKEFRHSLRCLNPFIDADDETLRVGGRIANANIGYDGKHPMLLPYGHPFTVAIIRHTHRSNLHIGQQALLAAVRQRFWPIRAKNMVRRVVHNCTPCYRQRPKRATQLMGDLPTYRVQEGFPFATVGLDYAGPFTFTAATSVKKSITTKGYVCVFVCMATRSIHLEAVTNLSTDAFLGAFHRFVSRRGFPEKVLSDNATNFVGANNELERLAALFNSDRHQRRLNDFCVQRGIDWSFIPPRSPHFGGIWEAGVKSVKFLLRPILAGHKMSYEEFSTVLCQIEATLNSRPLIPSSDDPNDVKAITPAHFLIGREFQAIPEPSYEGVKSGRMTRWEILQEMKQRFWRVWSIDFLQELQKRQRDFKTTKFKVGALAMVVDDNLPPLQWSLARITELHPGKDGHVRVVTLKTRNSIIKRAVKNICLLPSDEEDDEVGESVEG